MRALVLASILMLAGLGAAAQSPVWSPEAAANLKGFARGFAADCTDRCAASDGDCARICTCLVAEVSPRIDPRTLEAGGKPLPTADDMAAFVADNLPAFETAIEICGLPPQ